MVNISKAPKIEFKDHFSDKAATYASHRPTYPSDLIDYFASVTPRHELVWDCGCGSGQMSVPLTKRFTHVIATDASAQQVEQAALHPAIEYRAVPAEHSGIADHTVDFTVAAQAAHWFDLPAFYREVVRVSREGAMAAIVTYDLFETDDAIDSLVRTFYHSLHWPAERRLVDERYATMDFPFEELRAPEFFIRNAWRADDAIGYIHTWSGLRGADSTDFEAHLQDLWGGGTRDVRWPIFMRIGKLRA